MNSNELIKRDEFQPVIDLVIGGLDSANSKRTYSKAIGDFLDWWSAQGKPPMVKATVQDYKSHLSATGLAAATVNVRMAAIRRLAAEAADNGLLPQEAANAIGKVKGVKTQGQRAGTWLSREQAERLITAPDTSTIKGLRDRAILALMIGAGLRRSEVAALAFEHIQQREARWVIVDLVGKGNRIRTVPIPSWCKVAIDAWAEAAGIASGKVFRGVFQYGKLLKADSAGITAQAIYYAVIEACYVAHNKTGDDIYLHVAPHDLRRTFAKLARQGRAELTQIQLTLGHASVKTTENYIGENQDLIDAPCDRLGLKINGEH